MKKNYSDIDTLVKDKSDASSKDIISEFMRRLYNPEEDCKDDDCDELTCPKCKGVLQTVFGSLPLEVECVECKNKYVLKQLLSL